MARKSKELEEIIKLFDEDEKIEDKNIEKLELDSKFIYDLKENTTYIIEDKRDFSYVVHSVESIILVVIFAIIANCNTFVQIHLFVMKHYKWLDKHIKFDNGIPSLSTIKRVVSFINPKELETLCVDSIRNFLINNKPLYCDKDIIINDIKAIDGKTANSSDRTSSKEGPVAKTNAMSVYSSKLDCCEATEFISDKTKEIPTGPELLKKVNIENCIVTFDAMSTQIKTIEYIVKNKGFYVAPVKGNQGTLEENIELYFKDEKLYNNAKKENYYVTNEKRNGYEEKREYIFTNDIDWLYNKKDWKDLKSIGLVKRTYRDKNGEIKEDIRYYFSNIDASKIELLSRTIRGEWGIENKLHFYLDTVFEEDNNKCFLKNSQKNLNIIRKFCMTILKISKAKTKLSMNSIRFNISMDFENEIEKIISNLYE